MQQVLPRRFSLIEVEALCRFVSGGNASTGNTVIELQNPNPAAVEDMMNRGVIDRIGRSFRSVLLKICPTSHTGEMAIESLSMWKIRNG